LPPLAKNVLPLSDCCILALATGLAIGLLAFMRLDEASAIASVRDAWMEALARFLFSAFAQNALARHFLEQKRRFLPLSLHSRVNGCLHPSQSFVIGMDCALSKHALLQNFAVSRRHHGTWNSFWHEPQCLVTEEPRLNVALFFGPDVVVGRADERAVFMVYSHEMVA